MGNRGLFDILDEAPNIYSCLIEGCDLVGSLKVPQLAPVNVSVDELKACANLSVPFHSTKYCDAPSESFFHFYEDDKSFERFWNRPKKYVDVLAKYKFGVSTDFSMYLTLDRRAQQFNFWRNRATAYYLQRRLPLVIPNACWGDYESLNWAFDGLPEESVLAVSSQGCMERVDVCMHVFVNGLHQLVREKRPTALLVYGKFPDIWRERFGVPIIRCKTFAETRLKTLDKRSDRS